MKIVVGFDGSEHSMRALERAATYAKDGAEVRIMEVVDVPAQTGGHAPEPTDAADVAEAVSELAAAKESLAKRGLAVETVRGYGHPADALIEEAKTSGADLIVVGTHGRNALQRVLLGSVSTKVVQNASCDVLVVR